MRTPSEWKENDNLHAPSEWKENDDKLHLASRRDRYYHLQALNIAELYFTPLDVVEPF